MKVVTAGIMRELERRAGSYGLTSTALMQLAGLAVADEVAMRLNGARGQRVVVLVGPGNNGGDGLVTAFRLHDWSAEVILYIWNRRLEGDTNYALCLKRGIASVDANSDPGCERLRGLLESADVVVDSLLGIGIGRLISGTLAEILQTVDDVRKGRLSVSGRSGRPYFVSLDVPTGLNSDTGEADPLCLTADLTVTLGFPKVGLFLFPGAAKVGELAIRDIGIPQELAEDVPTQLVTDGYVKSLLPPRPSSAHKGTFGKVLVVGGSTRYVGAPSLASIAALRAGAGLVTLATGRSVYPIVAAKLTETTFLPLPEAEEGALGIAAIEPVLAALHDFDVLLIGPGLGRHPETVEFVRQTVRDCPSPVKIMVDADALFALASAESWWKDVGADLVLTPHAAEMARLMGRTAGEVDRGRLDVAGEAARSWGQVVVLKGPYTLIASPDGGVRLSPAANPALATAGTGDVLSGVIAGLLAQGAKPSDGATAGVWVHAKAGQAVKEELGDAGLLASDLLDRIPKAMRSIRESS